jgi:photosynthetic reaction center H subunit
MQFGAITGYVDLAQIILYMFWLFFAGLIYYLIRENHREGYPMETDGRGQAPMGWFVPAPKTFKLEHGSVTVPDMNKREPKFSATVMAGGPGSPLQPNGDPMLATVGAGSYAMRADVPDMMAEGGVKIVPLRVAKGYGVASNDPDPRGMTVTAGDGKAAGTVRDVWVDKAEMTFRYLEVETIAAAGALGKRVMLPVPFARIRRSGVEVNSIFAKHFANVPGLKNPDQITFLEEERIVGYFGGGTQYAEPSRGEPIL